MTKQIFHHCKVKVPIIHCDELWRRLASQRNPIVELSATVQPDGSCHVYHISANESNHRHILWTKELYTYLDKAATENYQSTLKQKEAA